MQVDEGQLRDFLIDSGLMTRGQVDEAAQNAAGQGLYAALARRNMIEEDELRRAAAHASGTVFVVLAKDDISPEALVLIPEPISRMHNILAYRLDGNVLEVALLDLDDAVHLAALHLPYKIRPRLTSRHSIKQGLIKYQQILKEKFGALMRQGGQIVDTLIHHALMSSAHGIHIDRETTTLVRYRIGSILREAFELPHYIGSELTERLKVLGKLLPTSSSVQEGRFKFEKDGEVHSVHLSAMPTAAGERLVLTLARETPSQSGFALTALGLHGENLERAHKLVALRSGLVLVASPKGGGKTTTLYTLLDQLNHLDLSIATVEEEIEHTFVHIAQTKIRPDVGLTAVASLRAVLKQDPDVVMISEIKDSDTAALAASAASRGVLVLAGIDARSAAEAIAKMQELGVSESMLAATLEGVMGVSIVGRLCPHEHEDYRLSRAEAAPLEGRADFGRVLAALKDERVVESDLQWKDLLFARAVKCSHCENGYQGLLGLQEVVLPKRGEEGLNIIEDGLFKAAQGQTSIEEVFKLV